MKREIIILALLFTVVIGTFGYFVIFGSGTYTTENINDYYDFCSHNENGIKSELFIFPKSIPNSAKNTQYYYSFSDTFLDTTYQIYLDCQYSASEFESEVKRISSINYDNKSIISDNVNFNLSAYVARLGYDNTSEYALIDNANKRIIYVYLQFAKSDDIHFDMSLLPKGYQNYGECNDNYTLY